MKHRITIDGLANGGYGVGRIDERVWFVPYGLPGDVVEVEPVRERKNLVWGRMLSIVEPSPDRLATNCPVFGQCGGCTWLHFAYPAQAEWKRRIVADCFERIAGVSVDVDWWEDPDLRLGYRTRAEFHGDGETWGFYAEGSREIVDITSCPLCHEKLNLQFAKLRTVSFRGSVEMTVNPEGDDVFVWTRGNPGPIRKIFPKIQSVADKAPRHRFEFDGVPIVNGAFSQSSLLLNRLLTQVVNDAVGSPRRLLDLYCGTGNFSLRYAKNCEVLGLDHNRAAVEAAASAGHGAYRLASKGVIERALNEEWDVVLLDPPRQGAKAIANALAQVRAYRIVYVSCEPATLARDVRTLAAEGWTANRVTAVDMFPHTPHIETVTVLSRSFAV